MTSSQSEDLSANSTILGQLSSSIEQLTHHLALPYIQIPQFSSCQDVHHFINIFEAATSHLVERQRLILLEKAFIRDHHWPWFHSTIKPIIDGPSTNIRWTMIIQILVDRFSDINSDDYNFNRLINVQFDSTSHQGLLEFVEDTIYCYNHAFRTSSESEQNNDTVIRLILTKLPQEVRAQLLMSEKPNATSSIAEIKKTAKLYDSSRRLNVEGQELMVTNTGDITDILKIVANTIHNEAQATQQAIHYAFESVCLSNGPHENGTRVSRPQHRPVSNNKIRNNREESPEIQPRS